MRFRVSKFIFLACPLIVVGCSSGNIVTGNGQSRTEDERINHPIHFHYSTERTSMLSNGHGAVRGNPQEIADFIGDYVRRGHGDIEVVGTAADISAATQVLVQDGAHVGEIHPVIRHGWSDHVEISFGIVDDEPPHCGDFTSDRNSLLSAPYNSADSEYGCSTQSNLAVMAEDPADLVHPRQSDPINTPLLTGRVEDYQNYKVPPMPEKQGSGS